MPRRLLIIVGLRLIASHWRYLISGKWRFSLMLCRIVSPVPIATGDAVTR